MKKIRKKVKLSTKLYLISSLIIFFVFVMLNYYFNKLNPKIVSLTKEKMREVTTNYLSANIGYDLLKNKNLDDIIIINKNSDGEILYLDYNLEKAYEVLSIITDELLSSIYDLENGKIRPSYIDNYLISSPNGIVLKLPLFIASRNALLSNLGPKIFLKVNITNSILTNIKTKVTNYGFNNALLEIYVTINIVEQLISPVVDEVVDINYDVLIAAKVVHGRVPEFYGGEITKNSFIYDNND